MVDPLVRATEAALAKYNLAVDPTDVLTHALVDAFLRLIAARSGLTVTMRVGQGLITRSGE